MHAVVAHHYWDRPGGSQLVCAAVARAFEAMGYRPVISSVSRFKFREKYVEWFGIDLSGYDVVEAINVGLKAFGIYLRLLVWLSIKKVLDKYETNIVFTDECTYKPVEKLIKEKKTTLIEYIHFPIEFSIDPRYRGSGLYYDEDPYIVERYRRFPMNIYWWGYTKVLPLFLRRNPFEIASLVLANSKWTAELSKKVYGEAPDVLNPPIAPNVEVVEKPRDFSERMNAIVMLGRFSEEKRYHWVIEELLPLFKKEARDIELYIFGSAKTKLGSIYIEKIEHLARDSGFKVSREVDDDADIHLIPDAPRRIVNSVMDRARVFLHATINEHWGIAVAEAMARGLPVVVHKSGGTWSDLVLGGYYGLGYGNKDEAVEHIAKLSLDEKLWRTYSRKSTERAKELTICKFIERLAKATSNIV